MESSFKDEIAQQLIGLDRKKLVKFAWRCALRALPFLGSQGHFDYWPESKRQQHLYAVFRAIDMAAAYAVDTDTADAAFSAAFSADAAAADAAYSAAFSAAFSADAFSTFVIYSAAFAAAAADAAISAVSAASTVYAYNAMQSLIFEDIKALKDSRALPLNTDVDWYGVVWTLFDKTLHSEDCDYWSALYRDIFRNHFVLDQQALQRRLAVPPEKQAEGAAAVGRYLVQMEKEGSARLNEARVIILGDKGAGKTSIARRLKNPRAEMPKKEESTPGVETITWHFSVEKLNVEIKVRIWDFAGHTVTHAMHQFFLSERCLYVIVYDGRYEQQDKLEYWLDQVKNYGGDSRTIILVNKSDGRPVDIPFNSLKDEYALLSMHEFSIRDDKAGLQSFRQAVMAYIIKNPSWNQQGIPRSYLLVKDELEDLFANTQRQPGQQEEYISKQQFEDIARKYNAEDSEQLLKDLHVLGVSLWYGEMERFNTLVLNPEWISQGVYAVINWADRRHQHAVTLTEFQQVFANDQRFPQGQYEFLYTLMQHYQLAYQTGEEKRLIIPFLMQKDRPEALPDFLVGDSLMLRYTAEQPLPPDTICRFIVRHHRQIYQNNVWRYGVLLQHPASGTIALIRELDRAINVSVKGSRSTDYIAELRATLDDIFSSYKSRQPALEYRVTRYGEITEKRENEYPLWLEESNLASHIAHKKTIFDPITGKDINLSPYQNRYKLYISNSQVYVNSPRAKNMVIGEGSTIEDNSTHNYFIDCNIELQAELRKLAGKLAQQQPEAAELMEDVATELRAAEQYTNKEAVKKTGIVGKLKQLMNALADKNSSLHRSVTAIANGVGILKQVIEKYNAVAPLLGMPPVPGISRDNN